MPMDLQRAAHSFSPAGAELCWPHAPTWNVDQRGWSEHLRVSLLLLHHKGLFHCVHFALAARTLQPRVKACLAATQCSEWTLVVKPDDKTCLHTVENEQ